MMATTTAPTLAPRQAERDELAAQRLVCRYVIEACERSLLELRCALGRASQPAEVRAGLRAAEVLEGVLIDWRDTLAVLDIESGEAANVYSPFTAVNTALNGSRYRKAEESA